MKIRQTLFTGNRKCMQASKTNNGKAGKRKRRKKESSGFDVILTKPEKRERERERERER